MSKKFPMHVNSPGTPFSMFVLHGRKVFMTMNPKHGYLMKPSFLQFPGLLVYGVDGFDGYNHGVSPYRIELFPGDMAYIPAGWIHDVRNEKATFSLFKNWYTHERNLENWYTHDVQNEEATLHFNPMMGLKRIFARGHDDSHKDGFIDTVF